MKIKFVYFFAFVSLFFIFPIAHSAETTYPLFDTYNKPMAIFLSFANPGMGQIYAGKVSRGLTIWGTSTLLAGSFLITVSDLNFYSSSGTIPVNIGFELKDELSPTERNWAWGLAIAYSAVYIYNVLDISIIDPARMGISYEQGNVTGYYSFKF